MLLFSSLFPVESPVELSKFGSGKVGLGLPKTPRVPSWRIGSADSARLFSTFLAGGFPGKNCQAYSKQKCRNPCNSNLDDLFMLV